ncbi:MAG: hypothetical protein A2X46_18335 [Lentisphaerae bacterium GWF2_57_35]|nr:MAG: hypothetical protein A2X46_18335 [Lentisphaerae bacterium GWF2_57_35]
MKSSYELAMERLERKNGPVASLSAEQKAALAGIERKSKADMAEVEIMKGKQIAEARAAGDMEAAAKLEEQKQTDIRRIQSRCEDEKEHIRKGS